jgi:hypothetical protein
MFQPECSEAFGKWWSDAFAIVGILIPNLSGVLLALIAVWKLRIIESMAESTSQIVRARRDELKANGESKGKAH